MEASSKSHEPLSSVFVDRGLIGEADLLKIRSFGKTSLREIRRKLADMGLSLGMTGLE